MQGPERRKLPAVEPLVPSPARVYATLLGDDTWSFDADRRAARQLLDVTPAAREFSRENREFVSRAARWIAGRGIRQFADLGAGLPVSVFPSIHAVVREVAPDARVAYVDNDPVVFDGLAGTVAGTAGVTAILGDLRDPARIFQDLQAAGLDLSLPACLTFGAVFHFFPPDQARTIIRRYAELAPPGSYLVISVGRADGEVVAKSRRAYLAAPTYAHGREEVAAWLSGLDLMPPGMTQARAWHPGRAPARVPSSGVEIWCGVARTPAPDVPALGSIPGPDADLAAGPAAPGEAAAAGTPPGQGRAYADRLLSRLDGKWPRIVIRYLSPTAPGLRPGELRSKINADREANQGSISKQILLACLARMTEQGLAERTEASTEPPLTATFYRLTEEGQDTLAALRRVAGATPGPGSWLDLPPAEIPQVDLTRPSIARVYDYWLGGKDSFPADRELARKFEEMNPLAPVMCRENRAFLGRAVSYVAAQGISQFIDAGAGLPTSPAIHEIARSRNPGARVLYADNDPTVITHSRALLAGEGVAAAAGDAGDPEAILASPELTRLIDLSQPCCVILALVLHFFAPEQAARIARAFTAALAPGSYLILTVGTVYDPDLYSRFAKAYTAGSAHRHSPEQIAGYFGDLDLIDPGLTDARYWRDQPGQDTAGERPAIILAGVGVKTT
jgi:O-methyltransferase involved in polyketide biosynthesis/DNA-binding HxlR family transcriptional regulator